MALAGLPPQDGTSFAAPQVAGAVARLLQEQPTATVADVTSSLLCAATRGIVGDGVAQFGPLAGIVWGTSCPGVVVLEGTGRRRILVQTAI